MNCRVRKEVRLESPQGQDLEDKKRKHQPRIKIKNKRRRGGGCAPSPKHGIVPINQF